jgi:hypothetical protein
LSLLHALPQVSEGFFDVVTPEGAILAGFVSDVNGTLSGEESVYDPVEVR